MRSFGPTVLTAGRNAASRSAFPVNTITWLSRFIRIFRVSRTPNTSRPAASISLIDPVSENRASDMLATIQVAPQVAPILKGLKEPGDQFHLVLGLQLVVLERVCGG